MITKNIKPEDIDFHSECNYYCCPLCDMCCDNEKDFEFHIKEVHSIV